MLNRYKWTPAERDGWYQNNGCHYEYMADMPTEPIARIRRPMGDVHLNMGYKWEAGIYRWDGDARLRVKNLGKFKEDGLADAMAAVEKELSQIKMF